MLLSLRQLQMLKGKDGDRQFKARLDLTDEEKKELLSIDETYLELQGEHLITNYKELQ
mgnify:CR=1 FL=1